MDDVASIDGNMVVELRAWEIHGTEKLLVAERVRDPSGCSRMIWYVPEAAIRGILWVEQLVTSPPTSSTDGIE